MTINIKIRLRPIYYTLNLELLKAQEKKELNISFVI